MFSYQHFIGSPFLTRMARSILYSSWLRLTHMQLCSDGVQTFSFMHGSPNKLCGFKRILHGLLPFKCGAIFFIPYPTTTSSYMIVIGGPLPISTSVSITLTLALVVGPSLALTPSSARLHVQCSSSLFQNVCRHLSQHNSADAVATYPIPIFSQV